MSRRAGYPVGDIRRATSQVTVRGPLCMISVKMRADSRSFRRALSKHANSGRSTFAISRRRLPSVRVWLAVSTAVVSIAAAVAIFMLTFPSPPANGPQSEHILLDYANSEPGNTRVSLSSQPGNSSTDPDLTISMSSAGSLGAKPIAPAMYFSDGLWSHMHSCLANYLPASRLRVSRLELHALPQADGEIALDLGASVFQPPISPPPSVYWAVSLRPSFADRTVSGYFVRLFCKVDRGYIWTRNATDFDYNAPSVGVTGRAIPASSPSQAILGTFNRVGLNEDFYFDRTTDATNFSIVDNGAAWHYFESGNNEGSRASMQNTASVPSLGATFSSRSLESWRDIALVLLGALVSLAVGALGTLGEHFITSALGSFRRRAMRHRLERQRSRRSKARNQAPETRRT
jgi:hypothetical protein